VLEDIQELSLLGPTSWMDTAPMAGKFWLPHGMGGTHLKRKWIKVKGREECL